LPFSTLFPSARFASVTIHLHFFLPSDPTHTVKPLSPPPIVVMTKEKVRIRPQFPTNPFFQGDRALDTPLLFLKLFVGDLFGTLVYRRTRACSDVFPKHPIPFVTTSFLQFVTGKPIKVSSRSSLPNSGHTIETYKFSSLLSVPHCFVYDSSYRSCLWVP